MGNRLGPELQAGQRRMLFLFLLSLFRPAHSELIRYTIPEELARGSLVGNLAKDLGLGLRDLPTRNLRVSAEKKFFTVSTDNGDLLVSDRIDREQVCGRKSMCVLEFEMVAEKPLNFFHITVEIQDVNDSPPTFSQNVTELEISELTPTGATFALESAQDSDVGVNSLQQYYLSPDPHFSLIQKENPDGSRYPELVLKAPLDREKQSCHHLVLMAVDGGEPARSCTTQIRVVVADANDNPPVFTQDLYRVSVSENLPLGSSVIRVMATDLDEGINAEIAYTFINVDKAVRQLFKLDSKTGELTTVGRLDFEERESYTIGVEAKDGGHHTAHCKIQIDILDENDNVPEITLDSKSKYIKEDTELGTVVALIKTHDLDSGFNGEVLCQIKGNFPFKIVQDTKNTYKLVTERVLDREKTPEYNVTITATDKGKPPLSSERSVSLKVSDVNDNAPVFHQASYVVHVPENNPPGTSIAQVNASDPDLGPNGQVSYSIMASDLEPRALSSYVSVNPQSGVVFAQRAFDHEQLRAFELTLQARDHGSPALSSNVSLRVLVGDRNDNAPRVLYPALGPDGSALFDTVPRAAQPGYLVTKVVAVDADAGHNAWLSYHVLQASEPGLFSVGLRTGEVRTARALGDRDAARQRLLVAVRDGGQPPLSATATLLLVFADSLQEALPDLSDRPAPRDPQAELQFYLVVALALISVLFLLAVILAVVLSLRRSSNPTTWSCFQTSFCSKTGPGVLPNYGEGTLPYSYNLCAATHSSKTEFKFLNIKPENAPPQDLLCNEAICLESTSNDNPQVTSNSVNLQQEVQNETVMAVLQSRWHYSGLILLFVLLGTLWEARAGQIHYSIPEELDKGSFVGNIGRDLGLEPQELAERGVRIVSRGRTQLFALNSRSGSLVTAGRIDREEICAQRSRCLVNFNILVEDKLNLFPVEVEIMDINDNAPRFLREELEVKITENAALSSRFPLMEVYDPDVGVNSLQGCKLNENSHFSVEMPGKADGPKYPELVLVRALDREEQAIHHLVFTAMDGGDPARSSVARILVTVLDANDNAPVFTQPVYRVSVPENLPVGTPVLSVNATDQDEGVHAEVTYSLVRITEKISKTFCLNVLTGEISTSAILDYEDTSFYELDIEARDRPGLQDRAKVLITILDVNDNVPEVVVTSGSRSVAESTPPGTVIILFQVYDRDSGLNGLVTCSISGSLPFELEKSVENYYRLVTNTVLDREQVSTYNITVTATDKGMPPLSTEMFISLNVADINDNPPAFPHTSYSVYIPENNPRGASIFSVTAHDPDNRENAQVTYSLAEDTIQGVPLSSYISINSDTGILYALHSFDYEQFRDLQLRVIASDSGDPPLSSNVSLSIFVQDQNDNTPEILYPALPTDGSTGVELAPRSAEPGYLVTKVVAVDRDSGQNAWLSYRLLKASEPGLFVVGLHTGEVRTARALLDRDALKQSLVVAVQDHGQPPLSATVTLTVAVADSIPDVLADLGSLEVPHDSDASGLTLYLVVAVAAVSCVFLAFVIVLLALRLRHWHLSRLLQTSGRGLDGLPASQFVGVDGVRAFLQTYSQEVSLTADSRGSHVIFPQPNYADTLISQESCRSTGVGCHFLLQGIFPSQGSNPGLLHCTQMLCCLSHISEVWAGQILYSVPEETETGSVVGNIAKDLGMEPKDLAERGVRIVSRGRTQLFSLNPRSGSLVTAGRIDREELCAQSARCLVNFNILVEDKMNLYRIEVEIMDINDNAPKFLTEEMNVKIMENTAPGVRFPLNEARDPDVGTNSLQNYHLSPNRHFSLVVHTGEDGTKYPELVLEQVLDREEQRSHSLILTALDGGDPPRSATAQIEISVKDTNDNPPVFSQEEYRLSVSENLPPGSSVLLVTATDQDEGANAEINYYFRSTAQSTRHKFLLDEKTGMIKNNQSLDFEDIERYTMEVEAKDGGGLSSQCKVIIDILDENDNIPEIIITSLSDQILEGSLPGMVVALFKTRDQDSGGNGEVTCHVGRDVPFKIYSSSNNYYKLVTDGALDREQTVEYNVTITATDRGKPPLSSNTTITLRITDINDNAPLFHQASYVVHVAENNPPGASITQVSASDPDLGPNGQVSYSIVASDLEPRALSSYVSQIRYSIPEELAKGSVVGNLARDLGLSVLDVSARKLRVAGEVNQRHFRVDLDSGALLIRNPIDREALCGLSASCIVPLEFVTEGPLEMYRAEVEIVDVNDHAPRFPRQQLDLEIGEAAPPGQRFPLEKAQDADVGSNSISSYRLSSNEHFALDVKKRSDGSLVPELLLEKPLDREKQSDYRLVLTAVDGGNPPRSGTAELRVSVLDVNDNAPAFQQSSYRISVLESAPAGMLLIQLNASDPDLGPSGNVTFSFSGHTPDRVRTLFSLHPTNGKLTLQGPLDFESENYYEFDVRARDGGSPAMEQHCSLRVDLLDVNDNAPHITVTSELGTLPESAEPGTVVALISVQDPDSGSNGDVSLRIPDHLPFALKSAFRNQFSLVTAGPLDREAKSSYDIMVTASDAGSPPLSTHRTIFLNISDVNDNPPSFFQRSHEVFVPENNRPGDLLCSLAASDPDSGLNALISYSLLEPRNRDVSASSFISLNPQTGAVHATRSFDYEQTQTLQFEVQARDRGNPPLSSTVTVRLFVLDLNDNAPAVLRPRARPGSLCPQALPPSVGAGHLVTKVTAVDLDSGYNAWVSYQLLEAPDPSLFAVSRYAGEVRTARALLEDDADTQQVVVLVRDNGDPSLSSTATVLLVLEDEDPEEMPKSRDFLTHPPERSDLTLYLIVALAATSLLSLVTFTFLSAKCLRGDGDGGGGQCCGRQDSPSREFYKQSSPNLQVSSDGTLKYMEVTLRPTDSHSHCYRTCFSPASDGSDFTFLRPLSVQQPSALAPEPIAFRSRSNTLRERSQQAPPNTDWRFSQAQRPGTSGSQNGDETGTWPNNQFDTEMLQAMILASASEAADGSSTLGGGAGTMGLSARYGPQFTLQHVPDYRQNVYIPGSNATLTNAAGKRDGKAPAGGNGNKKKSGKKEKK
nr:unnamed protein product [Rangifer tarandus platyrhynchus]